MNLYWVRVKNNGDPWGMFCYAESRNQARYLCKDYYNRDCPTYEGTTARIVIKDINHEKGVDDEAESVIQRHGLFAIYDVYGFLECWFKTKKEYEKYIKEQS